MAAELSVIAAMLTSDDRRGLKKQDCRDRRYHVDEDASAHTTILGSYAVSKGLPEKGRSLAACTQKSRRSEHLTAVLGDGVSLTPRAACGR